MKRPREFVAISVYWFALQFFWTAMMISILPARVLEFSGPAQKGVYLAVIGALGAVVSTVIQLVIGPMSDATTHIWGRRQPYLVAGTLLSLFAIVGFGLATSFPALVLSFMGIQLFLNVATGPYQALIPDLVPPERHGVASAYMGVSQLIGQVAGPMTLLILLHRPGASESQVLRETLWIGAALLLLTMAITHATVREEPAAAQEIPIGGARRSGWHLGLRDHPDFCWLMASRFVINLAFYSAVALLLYYLEDTLGLPEKRAQSEANIIVLIVTTGGLAATFPAGILADRMPKKRVVYASCGLTALAALGFAAVPTLTAARIAALVFGLGFGAFAAVDWALACNLLPGDSKAKYMAIWHFCFTVPQVIAPVVGGPLGDYFNRALGAGAGWRIVFAMAIVYLIAGTLLISNVRERPVKRPLAENVA